MSTKDEPIIASSSTGTRSSEHVENYEKDLFAPNVLHPDDKSTKSVKLDFELYLKLDRWKSKLRLVFPGKKITMRAIFNRGIYLVCEELKDRYGPLD